jgi:hypothetical protein
MRTFCSLTSPRRENYRQCDKIGEREGERGREREREKKMSRFPEKEKKTRNNFCRLFDSISKQEMINAYSIENEINQINAPSHCKAEIGKLLILLFNSLDRFIVPHFFESTSRIPYEVKYKDTRQRPIPRNHDERPRRKKKSRNKDKTKTKTMKRNTKTATNRPRYANTQQEGTEAAGR